MSCDEPALWYTPALYPEANPVFAVSLFIGAGRRRRSAARSGKPAPAAATATELQRLQLEQRRRQLQRGGTQAPASAPALPGQAAQDEYCWPLQGLRLAGVTLLPASALEAGIKAHMAPCMGVHQINRLLAEITRVYVAAGFIAVRPYLRHMPAAGRTLDITVDEGYVEAIELADQRLPLSLRGAFPGMLGAPLNLRDLEQGLDQLNRLRSVDMTADIVPGSRQGASRIILRAAASAAHWSLDLGLDNTGNAGTGPERRTLGLTLDSPLQLNDALSLSASNTLNHGPRLSSSTGLFYSVPYGYWTLSAFASHIEYRAPLKLTTTTLYGSGRTDQFGLRTDRVLWRNQGHQLSAHLQLAHKDVDAYLQKARLGIQSPTLTLAEAGFNLFWHDAAVWSLDLNYTRGLTWLGPTAIAIGYCPTCPGRSRRPTGPAWCSGAAASSAGSPCSGKASCRCSTARTHYPPSNNCWAPMIPPCAVIAATVPRVPLARSGATLFICPCAATGPSPSRRGWGWTTAGSSLSTVYRGCT